MSFTARRGAVSELRNNKRFLPLRAWLTSMNYPLEAAPATTIQLRRHRGRHYHDPR